MFPKISRRDGWSRVITVRVSFTTASESSPPRECFTLSWRVSRFNNWRPDCVKMANEPRKKRSNGVTTWRPLGFQQSTDSSFFEQKKSKYITCEISVNSEPAQVSGMCPHPFGPALPDPFLEHCSWAPLVVSRRVFWEAGYRR